MRHPTEGVLRRLLDEPSGVALSDREHVHGCAQCRSDLAVVRSDADLVRGSLANDAAADVDLGAAWQRLSRSATATATAADTDMVTGTTTGRGTGRATAPAGAGAPARSRSSRFTRLLHRPSVAALAFAVALGGAGTAAANDWFRIFATEQVAPVTIAATDLVSLPDLSAFGELEFTEEPDVHEVPDAAAAAVESRLDVPEVTALPRGVSGRQVYQVGARVSATFTFSTDRAAQAAKDLGETLPPPPPGLDGSSVRLVAGPGVVQVWESDSGVPALVVGRAVAPTAFSAGLPFAAVRDYLLSLPGLPDNVAEQLRAFTADGSTLPLPVRSDEIAATSADVDGMPATVLTTRDRALAAVVWVDDGTVNVVAGSLDDDEVLSVARELK